ncbi:hypothetical protein COLO4_27223 [Corchorus olitorius]|uniref:DUF4219 domain-containing protein n=1 Tax=Corchorus olitorius TaxID=93759 RepID=A0A1R3HS20_9ROSI|nr:hypothetical protein COLO4_27223 [Corchorus olitorius]
MEGRIVPELLGNDNYENWKDCMESYLTGKGLWKYVVEDKDETDEDWTEKNAAALHAIQVSCSQGILARIRQEITRNDSAWTAKAAWSALANYFDPPSLVPLDQTGISFVLSEYV